MIMFALTGCVAIVTGGSGPGIVAGLIEADAPRRCHHRLVAIQEPLRFGRHAGAY